MRVSRVAQIPPPTVSAGASVMEAVGVMAKARGGACIVVDGDELVGIFSERDVMLRVVRKHRDPETTKVIDVMTSGLETVEVETDAGEALELMIERHVRHLPVVKDGSLAGLLSIRNLLHKHAEDLADQLNSLEAYFTADGPGG